MSIETLQLDTNDECKGSDFCLAFNKYIDIQQDIIHLLLPRYMY
jgi:hypothetical protein